ncbi:MAG: cytochrome C oxidase subunit IV family protein [Chloroflexi bacterium]|nr:cytochrome C oxidase subunit IV family protein [Chloroflexota bacterium]
MITTAQQHQRAHPSPARYVAIALILSVITLVEVGVVYTDGLRSALLPILLVLSATKFAMVAMFYMHLRFDSRLFSALFVGGILLTSAILVALMSLFRVFFA